MGTNSYDKNCVEVRLRSFIVCPWSLFVLKSKAIVTRNNDAAWALVLCCVVLCHNFKASVHMHSESLW